MIHLSSILLLALLSTSQTPVCEAFLTSSVVLRGNAVSTRLSRQIQARGVSLIKSSIRDGEMGPPATTSTSRRTLLHGMGWLVGLNVLPQQTEAVYIDSDGMMKSGRRPQEETVNVRMGDDEFEVKFGKGPLGLDLEERLLPAGVQRDQRSHLVITAFKPGSQADKLTVKEQRLKIGAEVVSVEGTNIEAMQGAQGLQVLRDKKAEVDREGYKLRVLFRDPK